MYFRNNFFFLSNMYHYEIINNHIVVNIDGQKYLIDTGSPISFHINPSIRSLTIDGISYPLQAKPAMFNVPLAFECIGNEIDGFSRERQVFEVCMPLGTLVELSDPAVTVNVDVSC